MENAALMVQIEIVNSVKGSHSNPRGFQAQEKFEETLDTTGGKKWNRAVDTRHRFYLCSLLSASLNSTVSLANTKSYKLKDLDLKIQLTPAVAAKSYL